MGADRRQVQGKGRSRNLQLMHFLHFSFGRQVWLDAYQDPIAERGTQPVGEEPDHRQRTGRHVASDLLLKGRGEIAVARRQVDILAIQQHNPDSSDRPCGLSSRAKKTGRMSGPTSAHEVAAAPAAPKLSASSGGGNAYSAVFTGK